MNWGRDTVQLVMFHSQGGGGSQYSLLMWKVAVLPAGRALIGDVQVYRSEREEIVIGFEAVGAVLGGRQARSGGRQSPGSYTRNL